MNNLVIKSARLGWSKKVKNLLGKYVSFYTTNHNYVCGFVDRYIDGKDDCEIIVSDNPGIKEYGIRPNDLLQAANCIVYPMEFGVVAKPNEPRIIHQGSLITKIDYYMFDYINESMVYLFIDKKSGCIVFLTFSNVTKDQATVRMVGGFWEKEFTAKEFAETFDDDNMQPCCGCPCNKRYSEEE